MISSRLFYVFRTIALIASLLASFVSYATRATSGDSPAGYWYGTDSFPMPVGGQSPYTEPVIGGAYGGYFGMVGDWAAWQGCGSYSLAWSSANSAAANTDLTNYDRGVGTGAYWFMAGPGVDPHYDGTTAEAFDWGKAQAAQALTDLAGAQVRYPVVFMDVELPGSTLFGPATDNGWTDVYSSSCGGAATGARVAAGVARADVSGFATYLTAHSSYKVGVYSSPEAWAEIFGTGSSSILTNTYEWTYEDATSGLSRRPAAWCLAGTSTCADFFGGVTSSSKYALLWQYSGGGGTSNGVGDFDQINATTLR